MTTKKVLHQYRLMPEPPACTGIVVRTVISYVADKNDDDELSWLIDDDRWLIWFDSSIFFVRFDTRVQPFYIYIYILYLLKSWKKIEKKSVFRQKENYIQGSNVVPHRSTKRNRMCLTLPSILMAVLPSYYNRCYDLFRNFKVYNLYNTTTKDVNVVCRD